MHFVRTPSDRMNGKSYVLPRYIYSRHSSSNVVHSLYRWNTWNLWHMTTWKGDATTHLKSKCATIIFQLPYTILALLSVMWCQAWSQFSLVLVLQAFWYKQRLMTAFSRRCTWNWHSSASLKRRVAVCAKRIRHKSFQRTLVDVLRDVALKKQFSQFPVAFDVVWGCCVAQLRMLVTFGWRRKTIFCLKKNKGPLYAWTTYSYYMKWNG